MIFFYIIGWLIFAHTVLLRAFTCLKRRSRLNLKAINARGKIWPILSGHRGGSFERSENTLHAFRNAIS